MTLKCYWCGGVATHACKRWKPSYLKDKEFPYQVYTWFDCDRCLPNSVELAENDLFQRIGLV